jgi:FADH2 O2-dependent halogenase
VDHHFVREAVAAGVDYRDNVELTAAEFIPTGAELTASRRGEKFAVRASFVVDASGPGGFLARQLAIPSGLDATLTRASLVFSHFDDVRLMKDVVPGLPAGPYPDDWAAVHHIIDEGWMYSLRFDNGTTSAGFLLTPDGLASLGLDGHDATALWQILLARYPTIGDMFAKARPTMPLAFRSLIQHRLSRAAGGRWVLMPHAFAFVDPLFSTGIAWALRAVERLALMFEAAAGNGRIPAPRSLERYESLLRREADQIDLVVAGAYKAMASFDLFCAQSMLYFGAVSFAEASQRLAPDDEVAWRGFLGIGDAVLEQLPRESLQRLRVLSSRDSADAAIARDDFARWMRSAIQPRNLAGLADPRRHNLYPVDFDALVEAHALIGMSRGELLAMLPALRGSPSPSRASESVEPPVAPSLFT